MNKLRKNAIAEIVDRLQVLLEQEDEARDNIPESFWDTDRYYDSESASESLEEAIDLLESILE